MDTINEQRIIATFFIFGKPGDTVDGRMIIVDREELRPVHRYVVAFQPAEQQRDGSFTYASEWNQGEYTNDIEQALRWFLDRIERYSGIKPKAQEVPA